MKSMKKSCIPVLVLLACAPFAGLAQAPAPGVVTVTFNAAVLQTAEAQQQMAALKTKYTPRETKLQALNDQITTLQKQLDAAGANLSDAERATREQAIAAKQKELQRGAEDFKAESQEDSQEVFQGVARKMYVFLQKYAQQHNYPMIVERGNDSQPVVWYAAANLDITADLIKAYDAQAGVAAPKASAPSAPKPQTAPKPQSTTPKPQ
jgi:Skp family chaperone for outer membrane proteins